MRFRCLSSPQSGSTGLFLLLVLIVLLVAVGVFVWLWYNMHIDVLDRQLKK